MGRLFALLALLGFAGTASAQFLPVNCQFANTPSAVPCTTTGPANTASGDPGWQAFGKTNANEQSLFNMFGSSAHLATAGVANSADITGLWVAPCNSSTFLRADGVCATVPGLFIIPNITMLGNSTGVPSLPVAIPAGFLATFDLRAAGAKCDGVTADDAAWTSMMAAVKTFMATAPNSAGVKIVGCQNGDTVITQPINWAGTTLNANPSQNLGISSGITIDMTGTRILCKTNGLPCIDAMGLRYATIFHLTVYGSCTAGQEPSIGMRVGRINPPGDSSGSSADINNFFRPVFNGCFAFADYYDLASENLNIIGPYMSNSDTANHSTARIFVQDAHNHFCGANASINGAGVGAGDVLASPYNFFTVHNAPACDTLMSFNETVIESGVFQVGSAQTFTNAPIYYGGTNSHRFINSYLYCGATATNCIQFMVMSGAFANQTLPQGLWIDIHIEPVHTSTILIDTCASCTNKTTAVHLWGLNYNEANAYANTSLFALSANVTSVSFQNARINVDVFVCPGAGGNCLGGNPTIFDNPANYGNFSGSVHVPLTGNWAPPTLSSATTSGEICLAGVCDQYQNPGGTPQNISIGRNGMGQNGAGVTGSGNTSVGYAASFNLAAANFTSSFGQNALKVDGGGSSSSAFGNSALQQVTAASNTGIGAFAGQYISSGANNTAVGGSAMLGLIGTPITGGNSSALGYQALKLCQGACAQMTAVGSLAGAQATTDTASTYIGYNVGSGDTAGLTDVLHVGSGSDSTPAITASHSHTFSNDIICTNTNTAGTHACAFPEVITSTGTTFSVSSGTVGCSSTTSLAGGVQAGELICNGGSGASTLILTLPTSQGTLGKYSCWASDAISGVPWGQIRTANGFTVKFSGTLASSGDYVTFGCFAY